MQRVCLLIRGFVQGVGFRPFLYRLCTKYELFGEIYNDPRGVILDIDMDTLNLQKLLDSIHADKPEISEITSIEVLSTKASLSRTTLNITKSSHSSSKLNPIMPDISICDDCKSEIDNKKDRRYSYYFNNCTNCGSRYSIIKSLPYDRINTSMSKFKMCSSCELEYSDITNRRYHAEPISCHHCAPELTLNSLDATLLKGSSAINKSAKLLKDGNILAIKSTSGYNLVCSAYNEHVVAKLRDSKNRAKKPFAVMFKNIEEIAKECKFTDAEKAMLQGRYAPIVLLPKKKATKISANVAPDIGLLGCFLPYNSIYYTLTKLIDIPLVVTSANLSGEPITDSKEELIAKLSKTFDYYLDNDIEIVNRSDDSVVRFIKDYPLYLRRGRALTPQKIEVDSKCKKKIVALGAQERSSITLYNGDKLYTSPYIGDLENISSYLNHKKMLNLFLNIYDITPDIVVCDMHPEYATTKMAKEFNTTIIKVQHHFAHILSVIATNNIKGSLLGFAFDGAGYGDDGTIWGGEVLVCDSHSYKRVYKFRQFNIPRSNSKDISKVALGLLSEITTADEIKSLNLNIEPKDIDILLRAFSSNINVIQTSSVGKIFEAIGALIGLKREEYSGYIGIVMEGMYTKSISSCYKFILKDEVIDYFPMIKEIIKEQKDGVSNSVIVTKFINTLATIIVEVAKQEELPVALSGGVFQNAPLLRLTMKLLKEGNIKYYLNKNSCLNDSSISIGEAYYALKNSIK